MYMYINIYRTSFKLIDTKDISNEKYNTPSKSCNSTLYTKTNSATYIGSIFGTMCFYNVNSYQTMNF